MKVVFEIDGETPYDSVDLDILPKIDEAVTFPDDEVFLVRYIIHVPYGDKSHPYPYVYIRCNN